MTAIPDEMYAAFIHSTGGPEHIEYGILPVPRPGASDVLVRLEATCVNHVDTFVRSGAFLTQIPLPFVIGRDVVGTVVEAGDGVSGYRVGDRVWSNSLGHDGRQGSFSEYVLIPVDRLYRLPPQVDPLDAAPVLHTAATAYIGLFREASIRVGQTIMVGGAAGGVGSAVVQLASAAGARIIGTCSGDDADWCHRCGADVVIDYRAQDMYQQIESAAPNGIDIWWDTSGHHDLTATLPLIAPGGRLIVMAGLKAHTEIPVGTLYTRDVSIHGFAISNATIADLAAAADTINFMLERRSLSVVVGASYRLAESQRAHREMEQHAIHGRIVVIP